MADISREASPMSICEENLFDVDKAVERKKQELTEMQAKRASFVIGSIDVINERISSLNNELIEYECKLAIDSQASHSKEVLALSKNRSPWRTTRSARAREETDAQLFEGAFSKPSILSPSEKSYRKKIFSKKMDEPQLVELQQYPGFDPALPTPLPHSLETTAVLDRVVQAQYDLKRKPKYKQDFNRMFYCKAQRSILEDTFWWFFLDKFHPNSDVQSRLFKRVSKNYTVLFLMPIEARHKHVFLMSYGDLLAQSVYCTFCLAFPQSWRQFDEAEFKESIIGTCVEWVAGIRPRPRIHNGWNYYALEPHGMRKDESISRSNELQDFTIIQSGFGATPSLPRDSPAKSKSDTKSTSRWHTSRSDAVSGVSSFKSKNESARRRNNMIESCPAGKAVQFEKCVFNLFGRSPLLFEFFEHRGMTPKTGYDHLVSRTQIRSYGERNSKTYKQVVNGSQVDVRNISQEFQKLNTCFMRKSRRFTTKQRLEEKSFNRKSEKILAKPQQVRRLSTLILMDMKRDKSDIDKTAPGAHTAIQAALSAEKVE